MKTNEYMNNYMKKRYAIRRAEAIKLLGGKCSKCNSEKDIEFHHIDREEKEFTIANASSFSETRWQSEISKCQLLCKTCHIEEHRIINPCGTAKKYWQGCKCADCKAAYARHTREYKHKRKSI